MTATPTLSHDSVPTTPMTVPAGNRKAERALREGDRSTDSLVDAGFALALAILAVLGLHHVYAGISYLMIGAVGALVGIGAAYLTARWRLDALLSLVVLVVAFVAFSGVSVPDQSLAGVLPVPTALAAFARGVVSSWADLLTTAPPVGTAAGLGVVPYVCGFLAGGGAMLLARRTRLALVPVIPSLIVVIIGFLFGTRDAVSVLAQGAAVAALCLGWGAIRANRPRRSPDRVVHWPRLGSALVMVVAVVALASVVGQHLPFVDGTDRFNLRQQVVPPFDPRDEPSPLGAFRSYLVKANRDKTLFSVSGLPKGERLRLATMDTYDGVVWVVGGPTAPASGRFERVGESILPVPPGQPASVQVRVAEDRNDVWVPTVGATRSVRFEGDQREALTTSFRYNRSTDAGAAPVRLDADDTYVLDAQLAPPRDDAAIRSRPADPSEQLPTLPPVPDAITKFAAELTSGASNQYDQALKLEQVLSQQGYFSDGGEGTKDTSSESAAGHSLARIQSFLENKQGFIGNAEQYAATMALLARTLGLPARVVQGFTPPKDAPETGPIELKGRDIDAWVEVAFDGYGWVAFNPTPDHDRKPLEKPQEKPKEEDLNQQEPPPPTYLKVPDTLPDLAALPPESATPPSSSPLSGSIPFAVIVGGLVVVIPLAVFLAFAGLVVLLKSARSRRRRRKGTPVNRLSAAWAEACDRARDLGVEVPGHSTRREAASAAAPTWSAVGPLAEDIDAAMFGPAMPDDAVVESIWTTVDHEHRAITRSLSRRERLRAALSLASLRPKRRSRADRATALTGRTVLEDRASSVHTTVVDLDDGPRAGVKESV